MAITLATAGHANGTLAALVAFAMAVLVVHTRVESGVHTWWQSFSGAVIGACITLLVFQLASV
jgi:diacylglycerol kinase (ATP)